MDYSYLSTSRPCERLGQMLSIPITLISAAWLSPTHGALRQRQPQKATGKRLLSHPLTVGEVSDATLLATSLRRAVYRTVTQVSFFSPSMNILVSRSLTFDLSSVGIRREEACTLAPYYHPC